LQARTHTHTSAIPGPVIARHVEDLTSTNDEHHEDGSARSRQRAFEQELARDFSASIIQAHARRKAVQTGLTGAALNTKQSHTPNKDDRISLRPGGQVICDRISLRPGGQVTCAAAPPTSKQPGKRPDGQVTWAAGAAVVARYSDSSRTWKKATVISSEGSLVTVHFEGYVDTAELPASRVRAATEVAYSKDAAKKEDAAKKRRPNQAAAREPLRPVTKIHKAACPSEQAICTVRSCLSKLSPGNFERIAAQVVGVQIDSAATLAALVDLMFERAVTETHFTEIYAQLFAYCAEQMPCFDDAEGAGQVNFRKLLLDKTQREFQSGDVERKRKLGSTVFVGQLWLQGLLRDAIVHGCVADVLQAAEGQDGTALLTDAVEVACTLLSVIGTACDSSVKGRARMDMYMARLAAWAADKDKLPTARVRFKVMDVLDARKKKTA